MIRGKELQVEKQLTVVWIVIWIVGNVGAVAVHVDCRILVLRDDDENSFANSFVEQNHSIDTTTRKSTTMSSLLPMKTRATKRPIVIDYFFGDLSICSSRY